MHSKADLLAGITFPQLAREPALPRRLVRRRKPRFRGSKSGYMGVSYVRTCPKNPWKAYIRSHGQYITIGYYPTKREAALAFNREALRLHGPNAYLNPVS